MNLDYDTLIRRCLVKTIDGVELYFSPLLRDAGCSQHGFTGRSGGVSAPPYDSLNLGFSRPEPRENVMENYKRLANALGVKLESLTLASYAHGNAAICVNEKDVGAGITAPALPESDGLASSSGATLVTLHADCLCVLFFDPESGAYGTCHAGWRGTAGGVAVNTLKAMEELGAHMRSTLCWIGPGICKDCYEVDSVVIDAFDRALPEAGALEYKPCGKAQLDLARAMAYQLARAGVEQSHIELSGLCTCCDERFFSYRRDHGSTGAMAGCIRG